MAKIQTNTISSVYCSVFFALILDTRRKYDKYPVAVRVTFNYKKIYVRTGLRLAKDDFEKMTKATKGKFYDLKKEQEMIYDRVVSAAKGLIDTGNFTLALLQEKLKIAGNEVLTFNALAEEKILAFRSNGQAKTAKSYSDAMQKFEAYVGKDVPVSAICPTLVQKFKSKMEKEGLSKTTISIYLRTIRSVCNLAISKKLMKEEQYPFSRTSYDSNKVKIPKGTKRKERYLTVSEILQLLEYDTEGHRNDKHGKYLCQALDLWLFSYLGNGMNLADMAVLTYGPHYFKTKGKELSFKRAKTDSTSNDEMWIFVPITPVLKNIIERSATKPARDGVLFPFILEGETDPERRVKRFDEWNKRIGKRMKEICKIVGLEAEVSMTWARHSFKTNLMRKNVPAFYTEQAMGHVDNSVADNYTALCTPEMRMKYNSLLLEPDKEA